MTLEEMLAEINKAWAAYVKAQAACVKAQTAFNKAWAARKNKIAVLCKLARSQNDRT